MINENKKYKIEVKSEITGRAVLKFEASDKMKGMRDAYSRLAKFLNVDKGTAAVNYFVEVN